MWEKLSLVSLPCSSTDIILPSAQDHLCLILPVTIQSRELILWLSYRSTTVKNSTLKCFSVFFKISSVNWNNHNNKTYAGVLVFWTFVVSSTPADKPQVFCSWQWIVKLQQERMTFKSRQLCVCDAGLWQLTFFTWFNRKRISHLENQTLL